MLGTSLWTYDPQGTNTLDLQTFIAVVFKRPRPTDALEIISLAVMS